MNKKEFLEILYQKGRELYRDMPWRIDTRPYYVLVSELMLQQTQVDRVIPKFNAFIERFPDIETLAEAPLADVLTMWSGLGYNRRAKFLHDSAKKIINDFSGKFPDTRADLLSLSGVGEGTAGAILAYAFDQPAIFIETNVRTVYFYHFFEDGEKVHDTQVAELVWQTMDGENPKEFYWAIMDYGTWLKKNGVGRIIQSQHYKKQSALTGSVREVRGWIVRHLTEGSVSIDTLKERIIVDERFDPALSGLLQDGLVSKTGEMLDLTK